MLTEQLTDDTRMPDEVNISTQVKGIYGGPRGAAIAVLNRIERSDAYLDKLLEIEMKASDLNDLDKGLFYELVHGTIRWKMKLDWLLTGFFHGNFTKAETNIRNCLRVALYQLLFLHRIPHSAAVNEAVEFVNKQRGQKAADMVNAILRNIIRNIEGLRYPEADQDLSHHLAVVYSHPIWMVRRWLKRHGEKNTRLLLEALNQRGEITLRINPLKIDIDHFLEILQKNNVTTTRSTYLPSFVKVRNLASVSDSDHYLKGYFTIQDESAGLAVQLLDPAPGERVIDLCAAPGGKTSFIGEIMKNQGVIIAVDKYKTRAEQVSQLCKRLEIKNVEVAVGNAEEISLEPADKVLVDAPCSGLGVITKKPDIKWRRSPEDILQLVQIQKRLLANAATLVKPNGILVYSTCTMEPEENRDQIVAFLDQHPNYQVDKLNGRFKGEIVSDDAIVTYPHEHLMDGSFSIRLRRRF